MLVDSDTASPDAYPTDVVVFDDPLPRADSSSSAVTEVLVISHVANSGENAHDTLQAAMHDLSVPIPADADAETLEARRLALVAEDQKIASMRRLTEAHQREVDRAAFGTLPPRGASRAGFVPFCSRVDQLLDPSCHVGELIGSQPIELFCGRLSGS